MSDATTTLPSGTYNIDSVHSSVSFKTKHGVATFRAGFGGATGSLTDGVLSGEVAVDGIILSIPPFKDHLTSEDWFDAANHPTISWKSTEITVSGDEITFAGELTMSGVTKTITGTGVAYGPALSQTPNGEVEKLGIDITSTIKASEFGVGQFGLGDPTTIEIALELDKA